MPAYDISDYVQKGEKKFAANRPYSHSSQAHPRKHESEARVDKTNMADTADIPWSKSLENLPVFPKKEIDIHRNKSGKRRADDVGKPIKKKP